jgi:hypothetical protein
VVAVLVEHPARATGNHPHDDVDEVPAGIGAVIPREVFLGPDGVREEVDGVDPELVQSIE